jgi:hypothetical protein
LPEEALRAHIFPKLTSGALLSVSQLCDHGCSVSFDSDQVTVTSDERIILTGPGNRTNGLWTVHLAPAEQTLPKPWILPPQNCTYATQLTTFTAPTELHQVANNAFATQTKKELVTFLHASCFSPVPSTLPAAIDAGNFSSWPGFTAALVKKHLLKSTATIKGHLQQQRKNAWSTKKKATIPPTTSPPKQEARTNFVYAQPIEYTGQIYTD